MIFVNGANAPKVKSRAMTGAIASLRAASAFSATGEGMAKADKAATPRTKRDLREGMLMASCEKVHRAQKRLDVDGDFRAAKL
jgi:hypothetical protein